MWKLSGNPLHMKLVNQDNQWHSEDRWEFIQNGAYISIRNISTNERIPMVLAVSIHTNGKVLKEEFIEDFPPQQWIKGDQDENGFFTLKHPSTNKVLTVASTAVFFDLTISGKQKIGEMNSIHV